MSGNWTTDEPEIGLPYWVRTPRGRPSIATFERDEHWMNGKLQRCGKSARFVGCDGRDVPNTWRDCVQYIGMERWSEPIKPPEEQK